MIDQGKDLVGALPLSQEQFALLGGGSIAYVRLIQSAPQLLALLAADGTPIMLTDSKDAALVNAAAHHLETLSVH